MSRPRKPWLDWRREKEMLSQLLSLRGGVIRVQSSASGPLMEFANALRSHLEDDNWSCPWRTIQLDPDNAGTRYFGGMTRQIERSLSLDPNTALPISLGAGTKLGADIAGSEVTITNSFNLGSGDYEQAVIHEERTQRIVRVVRERASHESFCFLFVQSEDFPRQDLASFRELLWLGGLRDLSSNGVLLVDLTRSKPRSDIDWPPSVAVSISLPDAYDAQSREDAIGDLSRYLLETGLEATASEARAYSRAMLDNNSGPGTLYAQLAGVVATRGYASDNA